MSPENLIAIVRDILVIAYLFVLRIGVPLLITLMVGAWLRRLLEEKPEQPEKQEEPETAAQAAKIKTH